MQTIQQPPPAAASAPAPPSGIFENAAELTTESGDVLTTPLLPGLQIELAKLFKD